MCLLGLLGLRIFETVGADIDDLGEDHGHRVLRDRGKGGNLANRKATLLAGPRLARVKRYPQVAQVRLCDVPMRDPHPHLDTPATSLPTVVSACLDPGLKPVV